MIQELEQQLSEITTGRVFKPVTISLSAEDVSWLDETAKRHSLNRSIVVQKLIAIAQSDSEKPKAKK